MDNIKDFNNITYDEAVEYLLDIPRFMKKTDLKNLRHLLNIMQDPDEGFEIVHVAGTNGKGSVCAYLSSILIEDGKKCGLFTSPHLVKINERIKVNGKDISDEDFLRVFKTVMLAITAHMSEGYEHPSFFEVLCAMALYYFREQRVDYAVLETGLGGRLDATNVVEKPRLCIITTIDLDHTEILGDTIEKIATEKAGIIKKGVPVIFDYSGISAWKVVRKACVMNNCLFIVAKGNTLNVEVNENHIEFSDETLFDGEKFRINTVALYQADNARLAVMAARELGVEKAVIKRGLLEAFWPGRMQQIKKNVYLDGAHNVSGMKAFIKSARNIIRANPSMDRKITLVLAIVSDKDFDSMAKEIINSALFDDIIVTHVKSNRALEIQKLILSLSKYMYNHEGKTTFIYEGKATQFNLHEANIVGVEELTDAINYVVPYREENDIVFFAGSLYMIGDVLKKEVNND